MIEHPRTAARDGAYRELAMTWYAELADREHVKRGSERARDNRRHRHAAPREAEHDDVGPSCISLQLAGELFTRFYAICKRDFMPIESRFHVSHVSKVRSVLASAVVTAVNRIVRASAHPTHGFAYGEHVPLSHPNALPALAGRRRRRAEEPPIENDVAAKCSRLQQSTAENR
jgi:hypothetical protein